MRAILISECMGERRGEGLRERRERGKTGREKREGKDWERE